MFALDLFNNDHERRLAEGAVDQLEQRRIDDLAMKMDELVARAKKATTPEAKAALVKEFQKCKAERDGYYKINTEGQVTPTATGLRHHAKPENYGGYQPEPELKGLNKTLTKNLEKGMGIEFKRAKKFGGGIEVDEVGIPGNVPADKIPGKEDLLKGKGRSYYESVEEGNPSKKVFKDKAGKPVGEIGIDPESSPGNDEWYVYHYGTGYSVVGFDSAAEAKRELMYVHKHPGAVEGHPSTFETESGIPGSVPTEKIPGKEDLLKGKGRSYYEAQDQKKNSEVTDPAQDRLLTKARREHPKARSDAEALAMKILDKEQTDVDRLDHVNDREDRMIAKLANLEQNLQQQIDQLNVTKELDEGQRLHAGDPIIVTAPNEFKGATGEIYEFSPSGTFVIVDLYNHGKHSMHLSDVEYNQYADDQADEDDWYDDGAEDTLEEANVNPQFINARVTKILAGEARHMTNAPIAQLLAPVMKEYGLTLQQIDSMVPGGLKRAAGEYGIMMKEGFQDFNKVEPYAVCLAGKPVKKFDYYEQARRFHDNWKQKLYREGNKAKADTITLMPLNLDEGARGDAIKRGYQAAVKGLTKQQNPYYKSVNGQTPPKAYDWEAGWEDARDSGKIPQGVAEGFFGDIKQSFATGMTDKLKKAILPQYHKHYDFDSVKSPGDTKAMVARARAAGHLKESGVAKGDPNAPYTTSPAKPFRNPPGFNKQGTGVGNRLAQQTRAELANIQPSKGTPVPAKAFAKGVLKDLKKVNVKEAEGDFRAVIRKVMSKVHVDGGGGNLSYMISQLAPTMDMLRDVYHDDIERMLAKAHPNELKKAAEELKAMFKKDVAEAPTDYTKRRARERDVDAGKPVAKQRQPRMTDYQKRRAQQKKEMELGESHDDSGVEQAILHRIMVAHTDLLKQFGPEKVMQAAEEVAYNVGDVDEIGTSDVSAYVAQVRQILGA